MYLNEKGLSNTFLDFYYGNDSLRVDVRTDNKKVPDISRDSLQKIISQWKSDTSGCLRLRHPD